MNFTGPVCPRCDRTVYFAEEIVAVGRKWHKSCLKCCEYMNNVKYLSYLKSSSIFNGLLFIASIFKIIAVRL